jgi:hypothetical protein
MMKTPKCHRTFAVPVYMGSNGSYDCIGSACAMWVPAVEKTAFFDPANGAPIPEGDRVWWFAGPYSVAKDAEGVARGRKRLTVVGWCADNPNREPWPDPAGGGDDA